MILRSIVAVLLCIASAGGGWCASVAEVKATAQNWMQVTVEGIITYTEPSECYIESPDRSGGIWVQAPMDGFEVGDPVLAVGTFAVVDGEPAVSSATITAHGSPSEIRPFGMNNRAIGGASKWSPMFIGDFRGGQWVNASGANNTGMLVTTWGTVKSVCYSPLTGASWVYVDDGSGVVSDYGDTGVLVYADTPASIGDFVSVTGVSSTERSFDDPSRLVRVIRTRGAGDVSVLRAYQAPVFPFSDEFTADTLDRRWATPREWAGSEVISLCHTPGWLTLTPPPAPGLPPLPRWGPRQYLTQDWQIDVKVRVSLSDAPGIGQSAGIDVEASAQWESTYVRAYVGRGTVHAMAVYLEPEGFLSNPVFDVDADTCYVRMRRSGNYLYVSASLDGVSYCQERRSASIGSSGVLARVDLWAMLLAGGLIDPPMRAHFDYFRILGVPAEGGLE